VSALILSLLSIAPLLLVLMFSSFGGGNVEIDGRPAAVTTAPASSAAGGVVSAFALMPCAAMALPGPIIGWAALVRIRRSGNRLRGRGIALLATMIGPLVIVFFVVLMLAIAAFAGAP
jgi:hypothetical protein